MSIHLANQKTIWQGLFSLFFIQWEKFTNNDLANSAIASSPSILSSISKDINYSRLEFDFGNWSNVIHANYVTNRSLNLSVGIRPLFKDENSLCLFGDIVWI